MIRENQPQGLEDVEPQPIVKVSSSWFLWNIGLTCIGCYLVMRMSNKMISDSTALLAFVGAIIGMVGAFLPTIFMKMTKAIKSRWVSILGWTLPIMLSLIPLVFGYFDHVRFSSGGSRFTPIFYVFFLPLILLSFIVTWINRPFGKCAFSTSWKWWMGAFMAAVTVLTAVIFENIFNRVIGAFVPY